MPHTMLLREEVDYLLERSKIHDEEILALQQQLKTAERKIELLADSLYTLATKAGDLEEHLPDAYKNSEACAIADVLNSLLAIIEQLKY